MFKSGSVPIQGTIVSVDPDISLKIPPHKGTATWSAASGFHSVWPGITCVLLIVRFV